MSFNARSIISGTDSFINNLCLFQVFWTKTRSKDLVQTVERKFCLILFSLTLIGQGCTIVKFVHLANPQRTQARFHMFSMNALSDSVWSNNERQMELAAISQRNSPAWKLTSRRIQVSRMKKIWKDRTRSLVSRILMSIMWDSREKNHLQKPHRRRERVKHSNRSQHRPQRTKHLRICLHVCLLLLHQKASDVQIPKDRVHPLQSGS